MTWTAKAPNLISLPAGERYKALPGHLRKILDVARANVGLEKAWLFGSRARGDARENSDFDLAFEVSEQKRWPEFEASIQDDPPSLYKYDLVNLQQVDESFKKAIMGEGLLIYERR